MGNGSWNAPEDGGDPTVYGVGTNGLIYGGYRFATPEELLEDRRATDITTESGRVLVLVDAAAAAQWHRLNYQHTMSDAVVTFNTDRERVELVLLELQAEWSEIGVTEPVQDEHGWIHDDAWQELSARL